MCSPTIALTAISAGSSLIQYQQGKQQQKAEEARQKRQNALAKKNAIQRYASEALRIRQVEKKSSQKGFEATLKTRKKISEFEANRGSAGIAMLGSTSALMADYYRTESKYKNSLANNLNINIPIFSPILFSFRSPNKKEGLIIPSFGKLSLFNSSSTSPLNFK